MTNSTSVLLTPTRSTSCTGCWAPSRTGCATPATSETLDDLGEFLTALSWSTTSPARLTAALIADLGEHTVLLRHALTRQTLVRPRPDGQAS